MANRIDGLFDSKKSKVLSLYFTAGFPALEDTLLIAQSAQDAGADLLEIGMPFSDPVADGTTIQQSSEKALQNGMSIENLFSQLKKLRDVCTLPVVLMGYWNPILQYGAEAFVKQCKRCEIDGLIIPDLPVEVYKKELKPLLDADGISGILLVTPVTDDTRIRYLDSLSTGFIYAVSSPAITGKNLVFDDRAKEYFTRLKGLQLKNPILVGFGISNKEGFDFVCTYANGGIIGSAFIKALEGTGDSQSKVKKFVKEII